ncbi:MAG: ArsA-related P-loop ATPase [Actinomycetota bacterium]
MTAEYLAASNVLIVAGKGGVGKTTVGASLAIAATRAGSDVLLIELEGHSNLSAAFSLDGLDYEETEIPRDRYKRTDGSGSDGRLRARQIGPDDALADYLEKAGLGTVSRRLSRSGAMEVVSTAAPGIRDLLTLGKIRQLEQAKVADLIVVDAPAAGHAMTFLTAAAGLADSTTSGPVRDQADQVLEMFGDDRRCQVVLVTLAEETPVTETVETAFGLEEDVGIKLGPVVVNGLWPPIDGLADAVAAGATGTKKAAKTPNRRTASAAARHRLARIAAQQAEVQRLSTELPLPQLHLPFLFRSRFGTDELGELADVLAAGVAPVDGTTP